MLAVLLLGLLLVLGVLGLGVYLLFFRSSPPQEAGEPLAGPTAQASTVTAEPGPGPGPRSSSAQGPGNAGALESAARDYVDAVNDHDEVAATALTCKRADPGTLYSVTGGREVRLGEVEILAGAVGTAQVRVGDGETALLFEKQEDGWCVAI